MDVSLTFLTPEEVRSIGFASVGRNVLIDQTCRFHGIERIEIGSNVRIDAFTTIRAGEKGVRIGNHVHLSTGVSVAGAERVVIDDFCGLSGRVSIFSSNDDYSTGFMTNPTVPDEFRKPTNAPVTLGRHVIIGAGAVILPGVTIGVGASVGALSLVNRSIPEFMIVSGNPVRKIGQRSRTLLENEKKFLQQLRADGESSR